MIIPVSHKRFFLLPIPGILWIQPQTGVTWIILALTGIQLLVQLPAIINWEYILVLKIVVGNGEKPGFGLSDLSFIIFVTFFNLLDPSVLQLFHLKSEVDK